MLRPEQPHRIFSADVLATVDAMHGLMEAPANNHPAFPAQVAADLMRAGHLETFGDFEDCLRQVDSPIHCLAVPLAMLGDQYSVEYPADRQDPPAYALLMVAGPHVASSMAALGATPEENRAHLEMAGIVVLPDNQTEPPDPAIVL